MLTMQDQVFEEMCKFVEASFPRLQGVKQSVPHAPAPETEIEDIEPGSPEDHLEELQDAWNDLQEELRKEDELWMEMQLSIDREQRDRRRWLEQKNRRSAAQDYHGKCKQRLHDAVEGRAV